MLVHNFLYTHLLLERAHGLHNILSDINLGKRNTKRGGKERREGQGRGMKGKEGNLAERRGRPEGGRQRDRIEVRQNVRIERLI
eukprot:7145309-Karenia_brevis.AAC.1